MAEWLVCELLHLEVVGSNLIKNIKTGDPALAGPLAYFQTTMAQMRGRKTPNQQVGDSNPVH